MDYLITIYFIVWRYITQKWLNWFSQNLRCILQSIQLEYWLDAIAEFRLKGELRREFNSKMGVTVLAIDFTTRIRRTEIINCWLSSSRSIRVSRQNLVLKLIKKKAIHFWTSRKFSEAQKWNSTFLLNKFFEINDLLFQVYFIARIIFAVLRWYRRILFPSYIYPLEL